MTSLSIQNQLNDIEIEQSNRLREVEIHTRNLLALFQTLMQLSYSAVDKSSASVVDHTYMATTTASLKMEIQKLLDFITNLKIEYYYIMKSYSDRE